MVLQGPHGLRDRGAPRGSRAPQCVQAAYGSGFERHLDHPGGQRTPAEARNEADAETGGDKGDEGRVLVGLVDDARLEPDRAQCPYEPLVADPARRLADPPLAAEVLAPHGLPACERMAFGNEERAL